MNEFAAIMSKRTDADLVSILNSNPGDYLPEAMEAAQAEYSSRGLSEEQVAVVKKEIEKKQFVDAKRANEPLEVGWKILCCLFPGIPVLFVAGTFKADGYDRKSKEAFRWTLYGVGIYAGLIILVGILNRILI